MVVQSYRDLVVWQKSMDLVAEIYRLAKLFPREEQFGLISQIQRAAVSVPANIAEGHGRIHKADFLRHLSIARGSFSEVKTYVEIAVRLEYVERAGKRCLGADAGSRSFAKRPHQVHRRSIS